MSGYQPLRTSDNREFTEVSQSHAPHLVHNPPSAEVGRHGATVILISASRVVSGRT